MRYIAKPTNPADGGMERFHKLDDAMRYCSAAYKLDIRAIVIDKKTKQIIYRNYPQYALSTSWA